MDELIKCSQCGESKPPEAFGVKKSKANGRRAACRVCYNDRQRENYQSNPKVREWFREHRAKHPEKYAAYQKSRASANADITEKRCAGCGEIKPVGEFWRNAAKFDGRVDYCKPCERSRYEAKAGTPEFVRRTRETRLKGVYGITHAEYDGMLERQGGGCAICRQPPPEESYLTVDHCHNSGRVRGLLCSTCNLGLGAFKDSRALLSSAETYLSTFEPGVFEPIPETTSLTIEARQV